MTDVDVARGPVGVPRSIEGRTLIVGGVRGARVVLVWSRLVGLDRSLWHDEIVTVVDYVRRGPGEILDRPDPINHELFGMLAWATTSVVGESEIALRLWSVVPFVARRRARHGLAPRPPRRARPGILFLFLATASPLLLDISRQARGYGLAFLAMSVVVVAALEALRAHEARAIAYVLRRRSRRHVDAPSVRDRVRRHGRRAGGRDGELRRRAALGIALSLVAIARLVRTTSR